MSAAEPDLTLQRRVEQLGHTLALLALAAFASPISQHVLAPVYGALPSSINHHVALPSSLFLAFVLHGTIVTDDVLRKKYIRLLPLLAVLVPAAENIALSFSSQLGPVIGPAFAGLISCHIIVISAGFAAAASLEKVKIARWSSTTSASLANASIALLPFILLERFFSDQLDEVLAGSTVLAPADLQLIVAGAFSLLINPADAFLILTGLIAIATWLFNPHGQGTYSLQMTDQALAQAGWSLIARNWSTTGYISVLESQTEAYRVLRCDHSLLGGEWLLTDSRRAQSWKVNEPIYSVFAMLEAVRLIDSRNRPADSRAKALVIGLGIGNTPAAFIKHGIDTTIVELDPVIQEYAVEYFNLPDNHTSVTADAVVWVHEQSSRDTFDRPSFDYIVHDVFTGGAEPLSLFTNSFLRNLRSLLTSNGIVAINYAGDLDDPLTFLVLNTIDLAFDRQCKVYGDDPPADGSLVSFNNFVVFCRNSPGPIDFRKPTDADFLGSLIRRDHLVPKQSQHIPISQGADVLESKDVSKWRNEQAQSARRHWHVMRTVLPAPVWEAY